MRDDVTDPYGARSSTFPLPARVPRRLTRTVRLGVAACGMALVLLVWMIGAINGAGGAALGAALGLYGALLVLLIPRGPDGGRDA